MAAALSAILHADAAQHSHSLGWAAGATTDIVRRASNRDICSLLLGGFGIILRALAAGAAPPGVLLACAAPSSPSPAAQPLPPAPAPPTAPVQHPLRQGGPLLAERDHLAPLVGRLLLEHVDQAVINFLVAALRLLLEGRRGARRRCGAALALLLRGLRAIAGRPAAACTGFQGGASRLGAREAAGRQAALCTPSAPGRRSARLGPRWASWLGRQGRGDRSRRGLASLHVMLTCMCACCTGRGMVAKVSRVAPTAWAACSTLGSRCAPGDGAWG